MVAKNVLTALMLALALPAALAAQASDQAQPGATVLGKGFSNVGAEPSLTSDVPLPGDEATLSVSELPAKSQGFLLVSFAPSVATPLDQAGVLYLDLADYPNWLVLPIELDPEGRWELSFYLDDVAAYDGVPITFQAVVFAPEGVEMTNGLEWTVGY